jgi:hypothetical protein
MYHIRCTVLYKNHEQLELCTGFKMVSSSSPVNSASPLGYYAGGKFQFLIGYLGRAGSTTETSHDLSFVCEPNVFYIATN